MNVIRRLSIAAATASIALAALFSAPQQAQAQNPSWLSSGVIYCVNPEIFSTGGLAGVTSQLTRIHNLGCNILWVMPCQPRGKAVTVDGISHPSVNSPYCESNMEGIDPNEGTTTDFTNLVTTAHGLGMKVILDVALNQTSWDNPLITSNPQYYIHTDGNVNNVTSIQDGWNMDTDIAQFNLTTNTYGVQTYVTNVCKYWVQTYGIDGFRFDSADDPNTTARSLPSSLAQSILTACQTINPNIMILGEEEDVALALTPYDLDYGWNMWFYGVVPAFTTSNDESTLQYQWQYPYTISNTSPSTMLHMNVQDDWDYANRDNVTLGGYAQAMAAGFWDSTISGVPMIYNGMEVANTNGGTNSHTQISWTGTDSAAFTTFYTQLLALRNGSGGALQQGATSFLTTSSAAVIAYERTGGGNTYLMEINTNGGTATGTLPAQSGTWSDVTPTGAPGGKTHTLPSTGNFSLQGYDFAMFKLGGATAPSTPTGVTATAGNASVNVAWTASSGATSYNIYRSTTSGGEGTTAIGTSTSTSFNNTGLTNGTKYYYKVAAVNSVGTSAQSSEVSATPVAPTAPPTPTGLVATAGNASVSVSWTASSGATSYNVYRSTTSGGEGTTAIGTSTSTSYNNTGLTNGTKYYYKVAAVNSVGTSSQSSEVSATPTAPTEGPYGGTAAAIPGTVQAENYDTGGQGLGYSVSAVNGTDNGYRTDGVDLEACTDTGGGVDVGWSASGQWFRYTVNVATAGTYTVSFRVANGSGGSATMHIANSSGTNLTGTVTVPNTGGWQTWTTVTANVTLPAGTQILTLDQDSANINLNYIAFATSGGGSSGPYGGTAWAVPGTIQAENYDLGGQGVGYNVPSVQGTDNGYRSDGVDLEVCSDTGGGVDVGWTESGQWFKYTVNVATAKTYTASFRIASGFTSGEQVAQIHIQNAAGTDLTGLVNIDATGGWQTWGNATASLALPAGKQTIELYIDGSNAGFNINYFSLN